MGREEFIDATIHRVGETDRSNRSLKKKASPFCEVEPYNLIAVVGCRDALPGKITAPVAKKFLAFCFWDMADYNETSTKNYFKILE